ncbi:MAG: hypothetical protein ACK533_19430, partial [Planctomycetota bacterium]
MPGLCVLCVLCGSFLLLLLQKQNNHREHREHRAEKCRGEQMRAGQSEGRQQNELQLRCAPGGAAFVGTRPGHCADRPAV